MAAKKDNMRKDVQIRKLTQDNKRKGMAALKKGEEIKKVKKVNETLKKLLRPMRAVTSRHSAMSDRGNTRKEEVAPIPNKEFDSLVSECLRNMLLKIDRDF